ncbi:conjugal transfer protein TraX [Pseudomonas sp. GD03858]|uniref:TraX family protein n=1 Tax=unclassified Pseudomonas TaxID=196821 RepID=UPI00244AC9A7|nr:MULTISPECIES: TraX family protein [unclassified Pseudomonas]MDH0648236.1 conjugal transfer protein TraX [Pseudomonas sp. GD03867]MDH0664425.1 conjugal transfer protein TraX [Pseudomonas sp. GD03858]
MRSAGLDLLKWTAIVTMVADHLRYLWPAADGLFVLGRLAFPLFCLAIAVNVGRSRAGELFTPANARYLGWMLVFAVLSEAPYRWLDTGSLTFNVIPTLGLGLLVAWGVRHHQPLARVGGIGAVLLATVFSAKLMYGLPGVLLPGALLLARRRGGLCWGLAVLLAVAGNLSNGWLREHLLAPITLMALAVAALAVPVGVWLLRQDGWRVPPVGRWGYAFYPLHLLLIRLLQGLG